MAIRVKHLKRKGSTVKIVKATPWHALLPARSCSGCGRLSVDLLWHTRKIDLHTWHTSPLSSIGIWAILRRGRGHFWGCSAMQGWRTNMEAIRPMEKPHLQIRCLSLVLEISPHLLFRSILFSGDHRILTWQFLDWEKSCSHLKFSGILQLRRKIWQLRRRKIWGMRSLSLVSLTDMEVLRPPKRNWWLTVFHYWCLNAGGCILQAVHAWWNQEAEHRRAEQADCQYLLSGSCDSAWQVEPGKRENFELQSWQAYNKTVWMYNYVHIEHAVSLLKLTQRLSGDCLAEVPSTFLRLEPAWSNDENPYHFMQLKTKWQSDAQALTASFHAMDDMLRSPEYERPLLALKQV